MHLNNNSLYHKNVQITPINLELAAFQKHGGPGQDFFLSYSTDTREFEEKKTCSSSNSLATPFGLTVMFPWGRTD